MIIVATAAISAAQQIIEHREKIKSIAESLVSVATFCQTTCLDVEEYCHEATRIHIRLTYLLSRVPAWTSRIEASADDPASILLLENLYYTLRNLTNCVEAIRTPDQSKWRKTIKTCMRGKALLEELKKAESDFNLALQDLNQDNIGFLMARVESLQDQFQDTRTQDEKIALMLKATSQFSKESSGNQENPQMTFEEQIDTSLEEYYKEEWGSQNYKIQHQNDDSNNGSTSETTQTTIEVSDEDLSSLIIQDIDNVVFKGGRIGLGGFAEVFEGMYNADEVAIKVIDIYRNFDRIERMPDEIYHMQCEQICQEATIMKKFSVHCNVVDVYGYWIPEKIGDKPFIVMELMHWPLSTILHEETSMGFPYRTRHKLMRDISSAMEFLHLQRYVHQDIKPSNILTDRNCTIAKLADFGVTEKKNSETTWAKRRGTMLATVLQNAGKKFAGTRAYQAPEIILGHVQETSRNAEIYSFGVTLWECISRRIPHYDVEDRLLYNLAQNTTEPMLEFPIKPLLDDPHRPVDEQVVFGNLEKIAYLCLLREGRPNATQLRKYFNGTNKLPTAYEIRASLSKWGEEATIEFFRTSQVDSSELYQSTDEHLFNNMENPFSSFNVPMPDPLKNSNQSLESNEVNTTYNANADIKAKIDQLHSHHGVSDFCARDTEEENSWNNLNTKWILHGKKIAGLLGTIASIIIVICLAILPKSNEDSKSSNTTKSLDDTTQNKTFPNPSPSIQYLCFDSSGDELRSRVQDYVNNRSNVRSQYGTEIGSWCVGSVTDFSYMFSNLDQFNDDISKWNTSSARNMDSMFNEAAAFDQDLSKWDVSSVTSMNSMFYRATSFKNDLSSWKVIKVTSMYAMFQFASKFHQDLSKWDVSKVTDMSSMFSQATNFDNDLSSWNTSSVENMEFQFWDAIEFNQDISKWNVSSVTTMTGMFLNATSFNQDLSKWNVSNVVGMSNMFMSASSFDQKLGKWNVGLVTSMSGMFSGATAFNQELLSWNTSSVKFMFYMFEEATNFNQDLSSWDVSYVSSMVSMFESAISFDQPLSSWNVSNVLYMNSMFKNAVRFDQDLSGWDVSSVISMNSMFDSGMFFTQTFLENWNTSRVQDMSRMFAGTLFDHLDLSRWDVSSVTNMESMFEGTNFNNNVSLWKVSNVTKMANMFSESAFNSNVSLWDVSKVTSMDYMFEGCDEFNQDISSWKVSRVTSMNGMFQRASRFDQDLSKWNVGSVTSMNSMFTEATSFNQDLSTWDTSGVEDMSSMFSSADAFNSSISYWVVSGVTRMSKMFSPTESFNQPLYWDVTLVKSMDQMFQDATRFNQPLYWNVIYVKDMSYMFANATAFNQDLSNWTLTSITKLESMFSGAYRFRKTLCSWADSIHNSSADVSNMFDNTACPETGEPNLSKNDGDSGPFCFPCGR